MAQMLLSYMNGDEVEFDALIHAIETPLAVQRMMILSLNELGKAFLNVDKFVSQNQPYASTRPNAE